MTFRGGGPATFLFGFSVNDRSDGLFRRGDLLEGGRDDLSGLRIVDKLVEGGK
jgi:hypothetical protein